MLFKWLTLITLRIVMALKVKNISFSFDGEKKVLKNISFSSKNKDTIAIVGPSGCGKSTLLRLIGGILRSNKQVTVEGNISINGLNPIEWIKQGKEGFMFQEPTLLPHLTVKENIKFPLRILNNDLQNDELERIIETVGLTKYINYLPSQLSGGMKTRVALARTFITKPQLLLLDEPFGALDVKWKFSLYKELELLRESFSPQVIIVTHDIQEALLLSNQILVFDSRGTIVKEYHIKKPLPRVFESESIQDLQTEYLEIQQLIMNN